MMPTPQGLRQLRTGAAAAYAVHMTCELLSAPHTLPITPLPSCFALIPC